MGASQLPKGALPNGIDTDRLVQIANDLKTLEQQRGKLLDELEHIAGGAPIAPRHERPPLSWVPPKNAPALAPRRRGRPPGSLNKAKPTAAPSGAGRKRRKGLTIDIVGVLADGNSHTAGDIVGKLKLPATKSKISSVSTTLVRLAKQGRVKKDKVRGYRAA
jgi:hypothetical protein